MLRASQLFDVAVDPAETNDLVADRSELLRTLQDTWYRYAEDVGVILLVEH